MVSGSDLLVNFPNPVGVVHGAGVWGSVGSGWLYALVWGEPVLRKRVDSSLADAAAGH